MNARWLGLELRNGFRYQEGCCTQNTDLKIVKKHHGKGKFSGPIVYVKYAETLQTEIKLYLKNHNKSTHKFKFIF